MFNFQSIFCSNFLPNIKFLPKIYNKTIKLFTIRQFVCNISSFVSNSLFLACFYSTNFIPNLLKISLIQ